MSRRAREAHPAGKRRSPRSRADEAYLDAWWAAEREAARAEAWRRRYWMTVSWAAFVIGLTLWAYGLALIWSVIR